MRITGWAVPPAIVAVVALSAVALAGTAEARIPCGRSNAVGPAGATVYRTASGFTPTGRHIPPHTVIDDGAWVGDRVQAVDWGGYIATTSLATVSGSTC